MVGKGENAGYQHFLLFPQYFRFIPLQTTIFESHLFCRLQLLSILAFFPFSTVCFKDMYCRHGKSPLLFGKGLRMLEISLDT